MVISSVKHETFAPGLVLGLSHRYFHKVPVGRNSLVAVADRGWLVGGDEMRDW